MRIVRGDIVDAPERYILQQCNCLTIRSHGLSATLEARYPHANIYGRRKGLGARNLAIESDRSVPGTVTLLLGEPNIICLFGQWRPGKVSSPYWDSYPDSFIPETQEQRAIWFDSGLEQIGNYFSQISPHQRTGIAVPYTIGCGLAEGDFETRYSSVLSLTLYRL